MGSRNNHFRGVTDGTLVFQQVDSPKNGDRVWVDGRYPATVHIYDGKYTYVIEDRASSVVRKYKTLQLGKDKGYIL